MMGVLWGLVDADAAPVRRFQGGDRAAFDELVARYRDRVYNLAYQCLGHRQDAEDAAQEAFIQVFLALPGFRGECQFSTWLYRIVTRTLHRAQKRRSWWRRTEPLDDFADVLPDDTVDPVREAEKADLHRQVRRALRGLPEKYRNVLLLRLVEELSYEDIAGILNLPVGTVSWRLNQGKELLAQRLQGLLPEWVEAEEKQEP
jgi:RNA polymerase sigma-70 factor (ECF subfamily)